MTLSFVDDGIDDGEHHNHLNGPDEMRKSQPTVK